MKRGLIYLLVGACSFLAVGGGTLAGYTFTDPNFNAPSTPSVDDDGDDDVLPEVESQPKDKFMTNLLASNLKVNNLEATLELPDSERLTLSFQGAMDYDGTELAKGDFSALKASGDLNLKYDVFDETISFQFPGGDKLYFSYEENDLCVSISSFTSILDLIPLFSSEAVNPDIDLSTDVANEEGTENILDSLLDALNNIEEVETPDGYNFTLEIPDLGSIILMSDKDFLLTGLYTDGFIEIGDYRLALYGSVVASKDQSYVNTEITKDYDSLDHISSLVNSLTNILETEELTADLNVDLKINGENPADLNLFANLSADISGISTGNYENGTYELNILPTGTLLGKENNNEIHIRYQEQSLFVSANNLIKAKIPNSTIEDIIEIVEKELGSAENSDDVNNAITELIGGSLLEELIEGNFERVLEVLKVFDVDGDTYTFTFAKEFLNANKDFSLILNFENDELKSISIKDLSIKDFDLNLGITLRKEWSSAEIFKDLSVFKDYSEGLSIYNTISNIMDSKLVKAGFEVNIIDNDTFYKVEGDLGADLTGVDFNNTDTLTDGLYSINASLNNGEKTKSLGATFQDKTVYFTYNNVISNSIKAESVEGLMDVINQKFEIGESEVDLTGILDTLSIDLELYENLIEEVKDGNLRAIEDYIKIDENNTNPNLLTVKILPNSTTDKYITLEVNTANDNLESISISNFYIDDVSISVKLTLEDYEDVRILDTTSYVELDTLVGSVSNLINTSKFALSLDASIVDDDSTVDPINLGGYMQMDIDKMEFYGNFSIAAKIPGIDSKTKTHHIQFDNYTPYEATENRLLFKYYLDNNYDRGMRFFINNSEFGEIIDVATNLPVDSSIFYFIDEIEALFESDIPLMDLINGDLSLLFNDYIKVFDSTSTALTIQIDKSLISSGSDLTVKISHSQEKITQISILDLKFGSKTINASVDIGEFLDEYTQTRLHISEPQSSYSYVDANFFDLFLKMGINTTQPRTYHMYGRFNLEIPLGFSIYTNIDLKLKILEPDGSVNALITVTNQNSKNETYSTSSLNYRVTEFFIESNNDCVIRQRRIEGSIFNKKPITEVFKVTQDEFMYNIHYYLLKYTLDLNNTVFDIIDDAVQTPTTEEQNNSMLEFNYPEILTDVKYVQTEASDNKCTNAYVGTVNLGSIINLTTVFSGMEAGSLNVEIHHDDTYMLSHLIINGKVITIDIAIAKIDIVLDLDIFNDTSYNAGSYFDEGGEFETMLNYYKLNLNGYYEYRDSSTHSNKITVNSLEG